MLKLDLRLVPLWVPYTALAALLFGLSFFLPYDDVLGAGQEVSDPGRASLAILQEIMKFALSLNTAMLAGAGALILKGNDWAGGWRKLESLLIISVFLCGVVCYFGVYTCHLAILTMVSEGVLNPMERGLIWSLRLQYFGVIVGAFLLGLVFALLADRARARALEP